MAWTKQGFTTVVPRGKFFTSQDGTEGELSMGDTDGELYIRIWFPSNEHGKTSPPESKQLKNWKRILENADHIDQMVGKAEKSRVALRQLQAEKAAYEADIKKLNTSRTDFPDLFTDEVYAAKVAAIHAKYPTMFPKDVIPQEQEA